MLYDILFTLDQSDRFRKVAWGSKEAEELYRDLFESWAAVRRPVRDAFDLPREGDSGELLWEENKFYFQLLPAPEGGRWLLLKREDNRPYLLARALDQITDGVQIYDKNACAVYFNRASRGISPAATRSSDTGMAPTWYWDSTSLNSRANSSQSIPVSPNSWAHCSSAPQRSFQSCSYSAASAASPPWRSSAPRSSSRRGRSISSKNP